MISNLKTNQTHSLDESICEIPIHPCSNEDQAAQRSRSFSSSSITDYDSVSSPGGSSTSSGPIYIRTPGFEHHAHSFEASRQVQEQPGSAKNGRKSKIHGKIGDKKKTIHDSTALTNGTPKKSCKLNVDKKSKVNREPVPMRMRDLPKSFWEQPNKPCQDPPGLMTAVLPPLFAQDDLTSLSPVVDLERNGSAVKVKEPQLNIGNTDLLRQLFDGVSVHKSPLHTNGRKTNSWVRTHTGCKDLTQTVKSSKWNWAGHLTRRTDDRWTTKSTMWITDRGGRKRGILKKTSVPAPKDSDPCLGSTANFLPLINRNKDGKKTLVSIMSYHTPTGYRRTLRYLERAVGETDR
ncbi:hypothetical protein GQR58_017591 [Nymphon striatum]|nr:hypothetical protein GQR58_017591 [Nymphon striatum]